MEKMKAYVLRCTLSIVLFVWVSIVFIHSALASDIMIIPSPPLPVAELYPRYTVSALSGDGMVVAGVLTNYSNGEYYPGNYNYTGLFCWTKKDGFKVFYEDIGLSNLDYAITELGHNGTAVGYARNAHDTAGGVEYSSFRYVGLPGSQTNPSDFQWLDVFQQYQWASDVSSDGTVVVGMLGVYYADYSSLFSWTEGIGPTEILSPGNSIAEYWDGPAVSGDGQTIVANFSNGDSESTSFFKWTESGGYRWLGFGMASDISTDGKVIVGSAPWHLGAFRYTDADGMEMIGGFRPVKTNGDGSLVIGGNSIWDRQDGAQSAKDYLTKMGVDLDSDGWIISSVKDVSDDGTVFIGTGRNNSTTQEVPWIATITPPPTEEAVIDNRDPGFSKVGSWHASDKSTGFYGTDYVYAYSGDGSSAAIFTFEIPSDGNYQIAAQWPAHSSRAPDAPFTLINNGTVVDTILVDQRIDGGRFNPLAGTASTGAGIYTLTAGELKVTLTNDAAGKVAADAVKLVTLGR
jgi:hypothetical protein